MTPVVACPARLLLAPYWHEPSGTPWIISCELTHADVNNGSQMSHAGHAHQTEIIWMGSDRRHYTGELIMCPTRIMIIPIGEVPCTLPSGHHGNHAA